MDNLALQVYYYAILEWIAYVSSNDVNWLATVNHPETQQSRLHVFLIHIGKNHETTKLFKALIEEFVISQTIYFQSILRQYQICFCAGANLEYMRRHL